MFHSHSEERLFSILSDGSSYRFGSDKQVRSVLTLIVWEYGIFSPHYGAARRLHVPG
jgi:hypothetical protein